MGLIWFCKYQSIWKTLRNPFNLCVLHNRQAEMSVQWSGVVPIIQLKQLCKSFTPYARVETSFLFLSSDLDHNKQCLWHKTYQLKWDIWKIVTNLFVHFPLFGFLCITPLAFIAWLDKNCFWRTLIFMLWFLTSEGNGHFNVFV